MKRVIVVAGGSRIGKSIASRLLVEMLAEAGDTVINLPSGISGKTVKSVILDEHYMPFSGNRKARRAARRKAK